MQTKRGFTLIELLMVVVLLGILSAVGVSQFIDFGSDARTAVTQKRLSELKKAIIGDPNLIANGQYLKPGFLAHLGQLPIDPNPGDPSDDLTDLVNQGSYPPYDPFNKTGWRGPYVQSSDPEWNQDAWGNPIRYNSGARTLTSCGEDGICGGAGSSDDITVSF